MLQKDYFILYLQESSNLELSLLRTLQHVSRLGQALEGKVGVPGRGDAMSKGGRPRDNAGQLRHIWVIQGAQRQSLLTWLLAFTGGF